MPMMGRDGRPVPVHRLRPNDKVWTPPSVIVLDTETRWRVEQGDEFHTLRLWAAVHVDRRAARKTQGPVVWGWGDTPAELAAWLTERTRGRDCVWLYAHNLNFDLVTTRLAEELAELDWEVGDFSVSAGAPWIRMKRGKRVLTVCDSWSWLPERLESLATRMGRRKVTLPDNMAAAESWLARCCSDVELTARALLALMDWWDAEELGRWTISGASSGWNAMRHVNSEVRHVIDPEPELVAQDREAVRGGRKDAAVVRSAEGGPWVELDLVAAYPTVARDLPLPMRRLGVFHRLPVDSELVGGTDVGVIAEVELECDRPRWPVKHDGVTWFPVGRFRTVLAGPELAEARRLGDLRAIGRGQVHRLGFALRPWATWVLDPTRGGTVEVPPVALVACKVWGRSVLGKFAARSHRQTPLGGIAPDGWQVAESWDMTVDRRASEVRMGGRAWYVTFDGDTENAYPAVLAWVESETRMRLGRVLEALDGAWWTCDTDGLLVDMSVPTAWKRLGALPFGNRPRDAIGLAQVLADELAELVAPLTLRPKRSFDSLAVLGPQHLVAGDERRVSGVRRAAEEPEPWRFVSRDWPKLQWQMNNSTPGVYRRPERTSTFRGPTVHRFVLASGETRPVEFTVGPDGRNRMLTWSESRWSRAGEELGAAQYRGVARVV